MKGLINIKSNDNKCFLWCHIRHLSSLKIHPERITKADKNMANEFDYEGIEFPVSKRDLNKIEKKNNICINVFYYKNNLFYPVYLSDQNFDDCINLLMITDEVKNKQTNKQTKKQFFKHCLQCFSSERVLVEHRETCLKINDEQTVNLKMVQLNLKLISNNQLCHLRFMLILNLF